MEGGFGRVVGNFRYSDPNARKFAAFLSIPYALPPVGGRRYSPNKTIPFLWRRFFPLYLYYNVLSK